jgi:hypothetical protein
VVFLKEVSTIIRRLHSSLCKNVFRVASVLLVLTTLSVYLVCGLFAKYAVSTATSDLATVATFGGVSVVESQAVLTTDVSTMLEKNSAYSLNTNVEVSSNSYQAVSGTVVPKDTHVVLDGTNDVACTLYIEVVNGSQGYATFEIDPNSWNVVTPNSSPVTALHGGTIYQYTDTISPHEELTTSSIIKGETIRIKDTYTDKSTTWTDDKFSIDVYAYLVQLD